MKIGFFFINMLLIVCACKPTSLSIATDNLNDSLVKELEEMIVLDQYANGMPQGAYEGDWDVIIPLLKKLDEDTHIEIGIYGKGVQNYAAFENKGTGFVEVQAHPDKLFEIGSVTKIFTAYMTHALLQENPSLSIQTKLKDLNLSFPIHPSNETRLLHLLNHSTGLPKMPASYLIGLLKNPKQPYLIYDKKRITDYYKKYKTDNALGTEFKYGNFDYAILGLVLEDIGAQSYRAIFKKQITENLQLENTQMGISEKEHSNLFLEQGEQTCLWYLNKMESMGGAYSTMNDLLKFTKMIIHKNDYPVSIQKVLSELETQTLEIDVNEKIAQGWRIFEKDKSTKLLYHDGGTRGYKSFVVIDINNKKSIVILSKNCGLGKNNGLPKKIGLQLISKTPF